MKYKKECNNIIFSKNKVFISKSETFTTRSDSD